MSSVLPDLHVNSKWGFLSLVGGALSFYWVCKSIVNGLKMSNLRNTVRKITEARLIAINKVQEQLSIAIINPDITELSYKKLREGLKDEELSAVDVVQAYQRNALTAQEATNCVTMFLVEAADEARALDDKYKGVDKPPLFGIPFSVKESIELKGYHSCRGYVQALGNPSSTQDATVIHVLRQLGAIPIVQTNVPMSLFSYSCSNPVYGVTTHPLDPTRTPGGSSGGEGALIALNGAVFGVGGDVGGSLRIPAHFSGISAFKPGYQRLSQIGCMASVPGRPLVNASVGPMANDVDLLVEIMRLLINSDTMHQMDPYVLPLPDCSEQLAKKTKLNIGYYSDDGWFTPTSACKRAVDITVKKLEEAGHNMIAWTPHDMKLAMGLFLSAGLVDGGKYLLNLIENDLPEETMKPILHLYSSPMGLRRLLGKIMEPFEPRSGYFLQILPQNSSELRERYETIMKYRNDFLQNWRKAKLDCVIAPALATVALHHNEPMKIASAVSYTCLYNLLDLPAGVVPVTRVTEQDEENNLMTLKTKKDMDSHERIALESNAYDSVELPVAVQCVAAPHQEEMCMKLMQIVQQVSQFK